MKPTHMIRVLLDDGRVQRHYVEIEEPHHEEKIMLKRTLKVVITEQKVNEILSDYMNFCRGEWIGWIIDGSFYNKDMVTGFQIEPFRGIIEDINGYEIICDTAEGLPIAIRDRQVTCQREIYALQAYLKGLGNVHPSKQHAEVSGNPGDPRPEGSDSEDARQDSGPPKAL